MERFIAFGDVQLNWRRGQVKYKLKAGLCRANARPRFGGCPAAPAVRVCNSIPKRHKLQGAAAELSRKPVHRPGPR